MYATLGYVSFSMLLSSTCLANPVVVCASRYYGGWAAPQIYFLGFAGVIKFGNIRIGGLSGIYKSHDYNRGMSVLANITWI